ncbi:MAG: major facilitator super transporter protein [Phylliscum demangeonii]|nr:MAG: major facilitator super transporter protein [Phylliscum demangeonii]
MLPKQREMDGIVKQIYEATEREAHLQSTLLVLCGDHGMNDAGNHGGSSPGETSPALVFISPKMKAISEGGPCPTPPTKDFEYYDLVEQSDIVPTLSGLLDFPVPKNNLGVFIPKFLRFWSQDTDRIQLLQRNAHQLLDVVNATYPGPPLENRCADCLAPSTDLHVLCCHWKRVRELLDLLAKDGDVGFDELLDAFMKFSRHAQGIMSSTASNYDVRLLGGGIAAGAVSALLAVLSFAYGGMMFASSYVEEEHHFWYWMLSGWLFYLLAKAVSYHRRQTLNFTADEGMPKSGQKKAMGLPAWSILLILVGVRITRRWNQTGQKFAGERDIVKSLQSHNLVLWALVMATYLDLGRRICQRGLRRQPFPVAFIVAVSLVLAALGFKLCYTSAEAPELLRGFPAVVLAAADHTGSLLTQARAVFLGITLALSYGLVTEWWPRSVVMWPRTTAPPPPPSPSPPPPSSLRVLSPTSWLLHDLLTLFLITQSRASNIPLFLIFEIQLHALRTTASATSTSPSLLSATDLSTLSVLLQHSAFFALGNSNSLASIDLSNAYNAVAGYDVRSVAVLTFAGNWAGPIWWLSATVILFLSTSRSEQCDGGWSRHLALHTAFAATALVFVMAACAALRTHLFIWTVFSPKYLYAMAWCLAQHLLVTVGLGSAMFALGGGGGASGGGALRRAGGGGRG